MLAPILLAAAAAAAPTAPASKDAKVVVISARAERASEKDLAGTVTDLVVSALARGRGLQVSGESDVAPFLDEAARKQLRSCDDDAACLVEIGGALGTDYLVSVSLGALGKNYTLSARFLDAKKGQVAQRASRTFARTEDALADAICPLVHEMLAGLASKDARVGANPSACTAPVAKVEPAPAPVKVEPAPVKSETVAATAEAPNPPGRKNDPDEPPRPAAGPSDVHIGLRFGLTPTIGAAAGLALELDLGRIGLSVGTGAYLVGGGLRFRFFEGVGGPFVAANLGLGRGGPIASVYDPLSARETRENHGLLFNALAGYELALGRTWSVRGGVGFGYNEYYWQDPSRWPKSRALPYAPMAWELSIGPRF